MIGLLVVYCLKDALFTSWHGLPELLAILFTALVAQVAEQHPAEHRRRHDPVYDPGPECFLSPTTRRYPHEQTDKRTAWQLLSAYTETPALQKHALQVAAAMEHFGRMAGEDPEIWWAAGLLHDLDYEKIPRGALP